MGGRHSLGLRVGRASRLTRRWHRPSASQHFEAAACMARLVCPTTLHLGPLAFSQQPLHGTRVRPDVRLVQVVKALRSARAFASAEDQFGGWREGAARCQGRSSSAPRCNARQARAGCRPARAPERCGGGNHRRPGLRSRLPSSAIRTVLILLILGVTPPMSLGKAGVAVGTQQQRGCTSNGSCGAPR